MDPTLPEALDSLNRLYEAWTEAERRDSPTWPEGLRCPADCSKCCERSPDVPVTPIEAARTKIPQTTVFDRAGRALPSTGPLAEMLDRLLE